MRQGQRFRVLGATMVLAGRACINVGSFARRKSALTMTTKIHWSRLVLR
jgi:hypothetical protein